MYAQKIKQIRSQLNLSVAKLAEKINIPQRTITAYERNERTPSIEFLSQMCKILDINANWFLLDKGGMFNEKLPEKEEFKQEIKQELKEELFCEFKELFLASNN